MRTAAPGHRSERPAAVRSRRTAPDHCFARARLLKCLVNHGATRSLALVKLLSGSNRVFHSLGLLARSSACYIGSTEFVRYEIISATESENLANYVQTAIPVSSFPSKLLRSLPTFPVRTRNGRSVSRRPFRLGHSPQAIAPQSPSKSSKIVPGTPRSSRRSTALLSDSVCL